MQYRSLITTTISMLNWKQWEKTLLLYVFQAIRRKIKLLDSLRPPTPMVFLQPLTCHLSQNKGIKKNEKGFGGEPLLQKVRENELETHFVEAHFVCV